MAGRRMFAKSIIDTDLFLDMSLSTQALYFHLAMRADDDGFVNNPKRIQRMIGASDDELKMLIAKQYLIPFESGIVVIKHWKIHNLIRGDRYKPSECKERNLIQAGKDNVYEVVATNGIPDVIPNDNQVGDNPQPQVRLGKVSNSIGYIESVSNDTPPQSSKKTKKFIPPTLEEVQAYIAENNLNVNPQNFFDYYADGNWHDGNGKPVKSWKQKCRTWDMHSGNKQINKQTQADSGAGSTTFYI
jgi:hypothetical protein